MKAATDTRLQIPKLFIKTSLIPRRAFGISGPSQIISQILIPANPKPSSNLKTIADAMVTVLFSKKSIPIELSAETTKRSPIMPTKEIYEITVFFFIFLLFFKFTTLYLTLSNDSVK